MRLCYHRGQLGLHGMESGVAHQTHNRKRHGIQNLSVLNQCIAAANLTQMLYGAQHIRIVVTDDGQIMAVMRPR